MPPVWPGLTPCLNYKKGEIIISTVPHFDNTVYKKKTKTKKNMEAIKLPHIKMLPTACVMVWQMYFNCSHSPIT